MPVFPARGKAIRGSKTSGLASERANLKVDSATSAPVLLPVELQPKKIFGDNPLRTVPEKSIGRLIVAIDPGTTELAVATCRIYYATAATPHPKSAKLDIRLFRGWPASYTARNSTPSTAVYYEDNGSVTTGNELRHLFAPENPRKYKPERLIRLWKLMFHDHHDDVLILDIQAKIRAQLEALGKTAQDVMKDWAKALLDQLLTDELSVRPLREDYEDFDRLDLELVVAVPPGRSTIAHEQVLQAFVQGDIKYNMASLESEPAALFRHWIHKGGNEVDWKVGKVYLVMDGGGGTCCLVRFRLDNLEPLKFTQLSASESLLCGAEMISMLFEQLLSSELPEDIPNREWYIRCARHKFDELYLPYFGMRYDPWPLEDDNETVITVDQVKSCFAPCIEKIVKGIERQCTPGQSVDYLVFGGGLFQNIHILAELKATFPTIKVLKKSIDKSAIAKGAVLSKIDDKFTPYCEISRTKANIVLMPVTPSIRAKPKLYKDLFTFKSKYDGKEYFWAAEYLVKQGDKASIGQKIRTEQNAAQARRHFIDPADTDLQFGEKIMTLNYAPGKDSWAAFRRDLTLMSQQGNDIPDPEYVDKIAWKLEFEDIGESRNDLDQQCSRDGKSYHQVLKYSLQIQLRETGTTYRAVIWASDKMEKKTAKKVWFISAPTFREPLYTSQSISKSLADSFQLDDYAGDIKRKGLANVEELRPVGFSVAHASTYVSPYTGSSSTSTNQGTITGSNSADLQILVQHQEADAPSNGQIGNAIAPERLVIARPLQGQSMTGGTQYDFGALRNTGGCWICLMRHKVCSKNKPCCNECTRYNIVCEYGRPLWWYGQGKGEKLASIKQLIQSEKAKQKGHGITAQQHFSSQARGLPQPQLAAVQALQMIPSPRARTRSVGEHELPHKRQRLVSSSNRESPMRKQIRLSGRLSRGEKICYSEMDTDEDEHGDNLVADEGSDGYEEDTSGPEADDDLLMVESPRR